MVLHSSRSGRATDQDGTPWTDDDELNVTVGHLTNPKSKASAHVVIGHDSVVELVDPDYEAWHAGHIDPALNFNKTWLGLELTQAKDGQPYTDFQYEESARLCREWSQKYGFRAFVWKPATVLVDVRDGGITGHEDTTQGDRQGNSDPGGSFLWVSRFEPLLVGVPAFNLTAERDALWQAAERFGKAGYHWHEVGIKAITAIGKGER